MTIDIKGALRRVNWQANKRSLLAEQGVSEDAIAAARAQHRQGAYEACIDTIEQINGWRSDPRAWRLVGLCHLGMSGHDEAEAAFSHAQTLRALRTVIEDAKDDVNRATNFIAARKYSEALELACRARAAAPFLVGPHICILSIHNHNRQLERLRETIRDMRESHPDILNDPDFLERLENDTDLIGVGELLEMSPGEQQ